MMLLLLPLLLGPRLVQGSDGRDQSGAPTTATRLQFLYQVKDECRFRHGTQQVRYLQSHFYDRTEFVRFDSALGTEGGRFEALTVYGEPDAKAWNSRKEILEDFRAAVDRCRYNYGVLQGGPVVGRRVKPSAKISPSKADSLDHNTLLICTVTGFYPPKIKITWLKNGQEQKEGVGYTEVLQNGDWTYQMQVMLETTPERGDVYNCRVNHISLNDTALYVQWEPQSSDSARSKVWTGVVGAILGVVFVAVGLYLHLKSKKAIHVTQPAGLLS